MSETIQQLPKEFFYSIKHLQKSLELDYTELKTKLILDIEENFIEPWVLKGVDVLLPDHWDTGYRKHVQIKVIDNNKIILDLPLRILDRNPQIILPCLMYIDIEAKLQIELTFPKSFVKEQQSYATGTTWESTKEKIVVDLIGYKHILKI